MKTRQPLQVSPEEFFEKLVQFVDTDHKFYSHLFSNIEKPFYGEMDKNAFKIENTPNLLYRDSIIVIKGKISKDELEYSTQIKNLIAINLFTVVGLGVLIISFYFLENDFRKFLFIPVIITVPYIILPYVIYRNKFKKIIEKINNTRT